MTETAPEPAAAQNDTAESVGLTPHQWKQPWRERFLVVLARTGNASGAARAARISRMQAYRTRDEDPEFLAAWREAEQVYGDLLEQVAWRRGTVGDPVRRVTTRTKRDDTGQVLEQEVTVVESTRVSDRLLEVQLRAAKPEKYGDRLTLAGDPDAPVQVEVGPRERSDERRAELVRIALEHGMDAALGPAGAA